MRRMAVPHMGDPTAQVRLHIDDAGAMLRARAVLHTVVQLRLEPIAFVPRHGAVHVEHVAAFRGELHRAGEVFAGDAA